MHDAIVNRPSQDNASLRTLPLLFGPRVSRTAFSYQGFLDKLRRPANQMPPYEAAVLSDQDAADLFAYLRQMPPPRDPNSIPLLKSAR
jgi:cytochrome c553